MSVKSYTGINNPVPQTLPENSSQVKNNAGGFVFEISDIDYVKRFLIIGIEGNNFYATESQLQYEASENLKRIVEEKGKEVVDLIVEVSDKGLAAKNDPALFLLALCAASKNKDTRKYALVNLWKVARIPTHLYHFMLFVKPLRGRGKLLDKALEKWFNNKTPKDLAFSLTKYESRDGFSARDVLRLAKPVPPTEGHKIVYNYATWTEKKESSGKKLLINEPYSPEYREIVNFLKAVDNIKSGKIKDDRLVKLVKEYRFPMEIVPTEKRTPKIYEAVLEHAGMTWILRNLSNMSSANILDSDSSNAVKFICEKLNNEEEIKKARLHPINVLAALKIYSAGHGYKGKNTWVPSNKIIKVLENTFYKSFNYVEPTGKNYYIGLDCSGSMFGNKVFGMPFIDAATVGACIAMTVVKKEKNCVIKGFSDNMIEIELSPDDNLEKVIKKMSKVKWNTTDCALPMIDAKVYKDSFDVFIEITDNETYYGNVHPHVALKNYRKLKNTASKLIVLATTLSRFSIADPKDQGMLDIAGFSSDVPTIIANFSNI
jgi:60 kDa SS-A/Ro ribonucleoprotein